MSVLMIALGGFFLGGTWALHQQKRPWWAQGLALAFAVLCIVAGVLYL